MGILAACFNATGEIRDKSFCVVQLLEHMDCSGVQVCNEYGCPLLSLFQFVPSDCISHSVSVVHECSSTCVFRRINTTTIVERKHVKSCFVHDLSNNLYALNVYCMHFCH